MTCIRSLISIFLCGFLLVGCSGHSTSTDLVSSTSEYLTADQRIKSLIDAYTAVNTYSVCWHDSPDFSYSEMLTGLIRQASKPIDVYEYCTLLEKLTAVTGDAHNHFSYNAAMSEAFGYLTYQFNDIDHQYIVTGVSPTSQVPLGSELVKIQGEDAGSYLEKQIAPLVTARTFRLKQNRMLERFVYNRQGESLQLTWKLPDGEEKITNEVYEKGTRRITQTYAKPEITGHKVKILHQSTTYDVLVLEDKIIYLHLKVISDLGSSYFIEVLPQIKDYKYFIIDIRDNLGGSDIGAVQLLSSFYDEIRNFQSFELTSDIERMGSHLASHPQREYIYTQPETCDLTDFRESELDPIQADRLLLLTNYNTMSAAESLALLASDLDSFLLMGTPTAGSCGLRYDVSLEDLGFTFAFTSKGSLDYEGQSLYGKGIEPDLLIEQTVDDLKQGIDTVLEAAISQILP